MNQMCYVTINLKNNGKPMNRNSFVSHDLQNARAHHPQFLKYR